MHKKIMSYISEELGAAPKSGMSKEKLFVMGLTALLLISLYGYAKKTLNKSFTQGAEAVEKINQGDKSAIEGIQDFKAD